jgi:hypothetical protein
LPDVTSALYPNDAVMPDHRGGKTAGKTSVGASVSAGALTSFGAEVVLTSAQSKLEGGDLTGADAILTTIQERTPARLIPADLPLLRADESLGLARIAIASEHAQELKSQLETAAAALDAYQGQAHAADAHALAQAIDRVLKQPGSLDHMQSDQLDLWSGRVDGWG